MFPYFYKGIWKPFSDNTFRRELATILTIYYGINYNPKIHRAHSFRYGGVTDLGSIGIPLELIRRISGHAPESKVLLLYLKLSPEMVASLIKDKSKESKEILKRYNKQLKKWKINH